MHIPGLYIFVPEMLELGPGDSDAHSGLRTAGVREGFPERVYQDGLKKDE